MSNSEEKQEVKSAWLYQGSSDFEIPQKAIAFLYRITHLSSGRWYIGRKGLYKTAYRQVKGKKKKLKVESDWKAYWSSSDEINDMVIAEGEGAFKREILMFTETDAQTLFGEEHLLHISNALFDPMSFNGNIRAKIFKSWFIHEKNDEFKKILTNMSNLLRNEK